MKSRLILLAALLCLYAIPAIADDAPKAEIFGEYSYFRFNPSLPGIRNTSFNGGGGGVTFNLNNFIGIKAEFMGYGSTNYTIPAGTPIPGSGASIKQLLRLPLRAICLPIYSDLKSPIACRN